MDHSIIILILIAAAALRGAYVLYRPKAKSETARGSKLLGVHGTHLSAIAPDFPRRRGQDSDGSSDGGGDGGDGGGDGGGS